MSGFITGFIYPRGCNLARPDSGTCCSDPGFRCRRLFSASRECFLMGCRGSRKCHRGLIILFEIRLEQISLKRLIGAAFGSVLGIAGAFLMSLVLGQGGRPAFPAGGPAAADDVCRTDRRRQEGRHAQSGGAGRHFRRREVLQKVAQDPGHQRHHRRPHRRYRRNRISGRRAGDSAVRAARTATGGRFGRFHEAQPRPPRPRHSAAHSEDGAP